MRGPLVSEAQSWAETFNARTVRRPHMSVTEKDAALKCTVKLGPPASDSNAEALYLIAGPLAVTG